MSGGARVIEALHAERRRHAACVEWAWGAGLGTLCHLWLCVVAALDKTNNRAEPRKSAERRISARSVTDSSLDRDPIRFTQIGPDPESVPRSVRSPMAI